MTWTRGEKYLAISFVIGVCHHIDHVLRYDHSGWPFRPEVTPFTYSLLVYPIFLVAALSWRYSLLRITATALLFGFTTFAHVYFETPFDQYRTWAEGSPVPLHGIQHTLLNTESRTAGILAATVTVLLSLFLGLALWQFILEWRHGEAVKLRPSV
jgi:hypothetical protein